MLTEGDDFPIHQLPEPIAFAGTDRNFYDRYFFNGYAPDQSCFFAIAFGVYPHANIADAHFAVIRNGTEHCIHASRVLNMERMNLAVGPIRIVVEKPLQRLRVIVSDYQGISADLLFEGRSFPIQEPRFLYRNGPRVIFDYTRLTQNGHWSGWISIDGARQELPADATGTRDRSWGVRPLGIHDPQPQVPPIPQGVYWRWTPLNFTNRSVFFHVNADGKGNAWNTRAAIVPDGGQVNDIIHVHGAIDTPMLPGTRYARSGALHLQDDSGRAYHITLEPTPIRFIMRGIGYFSPNWAHGLYKGELAVEREDIDLATVDPARPENFHVQVLSKLTLETEGAPPDHGIGTFEQLIIGPYAPLGLNETDVISNG